MSRVRRARFVVRVLKAALGDREMVEHCIGVATRIAEDHGGAEGFAQVQAFVERDREALPVSRREDFQQP